MADEQHDSTPTFLAPQLGFSAGRFGTQLVGLLVGAGSKLGGVHECESGLAV
jgi:hypothetical protein